MSDLVRQLITNHNRIEATRAMSDDNEPKRCPRCERAVRLTSKGAIGKHDQGPFHRRTCEASGKDYAQAWERRREGGAV